MVFDGVFVFVVDSWQFTFSSQLVPWGVNDFVVKVNVFYFGFLFMGGFDAVTPDYLDAVVFWRVMRSRDYYAAVHLVVFSGKLDGMA